MEQFDQYFEVIPAKTEKLIGACKNLRYQVFCKEHHILSSDQEKYEIEQDYYDKRASHALLKHRPSGSYAATVRLVLPDSTESHFTYPIEEQLSKFEDNTFDRIHRIPKTQTAEISRFSVSKQFRRREGESKLSHGINDNFGKKPDASERRFDAHITLGLFKAIVQMSYENDINNWIAFMEPGLIRLLSRVGIKFQKVGPVINYCGKRHACYENAYQVLSGIRSTRPDIWHFITDSGKHSLH